MMCIIITNPNPEYEALVTRQLCTKFKGCWALSTPEAQEKRV